MQNVTSQNKVPNRLHWLIYSFELKHKIAGTVPVSVIAVQTVCAAPSHPQLPSYVLEIVKGDYVTIADHTVGIVGIGVDILIWLN